MTLLIWHSETKPYIFVQDHDLCIWPLYWPYLTRAHKDWDTSLPIVKRAWSYLPDYKNTQDVLNRPMKRQPSPVLDPLYEREESDVLIYVKMIPVSYSQYHTKTNVWLADINQYRPSLIVWDGSDVFVLDYQILKRKKYIQGAAALVADLWTNLLQYEAALGIQDMMDLKTRKTVREMRLNKSNKDHTLKRKIIAHRNKMQEAIEAAAQEDDGYVPDLSPISLRRAARRIK